METNSNTGAVRNHAPLNHFVVLILWLGLGALSITKADPSGKTNQNSDPLDPSKVPSQSNAVKSQEPFRPAFDPNSPYPEAESVKLSGKELKELLAKIEKEMGTLIMLKTDLIQEKHLSIFNDVIRSEGVCLFQKPDKVRLDTIRPYRSSLIAAGKRVAKYEYNNGKWNKLKTPSENIVLMVTKQIADWLQGKFDSKNSIYNISAFKGRRTTIVLDPKNKELKATLNAIVLTLAVDRCRIESVTIREEGNDYTTMRFSQALENIELPEGIFDTHSPEPTEIHIPSPPIYLKTESRGTKPEK